MSVWGTHCAVDGLHPLRLLDEDYDPATTGAGAAAAELFRALGEPG